MLDLENNMDELFRKASENYPLKSGKSGWEDISAFITKNNPAAAKKTSGKKRYVALFLLLLGILLGGIIFLDTISSDSARGSKPREPKTDAISIPAENNTHINHDNFKVNSEQSIVKSGEKKQPDKILKHKGIYHADALLKISVHRQEAFSPLPENKNNSNSIVLPQDDSSINQILSKIKINSEEKLTATSEKAEPKKIIVDKQIENSKKEDQLQKAKRFYFGLAAGPSFSEVKGQGLKKPGMDAGVLAGYQLNKNFSIESGFFFSKKYYFSDGKYFNKSKMPASMEVLSLQSSSNLFEIPVKMRYHFKPANKNHFTISGAVSSWILTKEKNDYRLLVNGAPQNMISIYDDSHSYFGASISLSAGYERKISKYSTVRIEPYLKIPLKGIGVGSLQVMSTGLQFAITRQSH